MPTRSLPLRPNLAQLKRQAAELRRAHGDQRPAAAARVAAHHPRLKGMSPAAVLDRPLTTADAQLVLAREYGFQSWARLKQRVDVDRRVAECTPHPHFEGAVAALDAGDIDRLRDLMTRHPDVIRARANLDPPYDYFTGATLLHYVAWNPGREVSVPDNIADIARLVLDAGADVNAVTLGPNGGTTLGLVVTSKQASDANASPALIDVLLEYGGRLDPERAPDATPEWHAPGVLDAALANHAPRAAEKLIALGATPDLCAAAALGRMDLLRSCFERGGRLRSPPRRHGRVLAARDAIGLAMLFAYVNRHHDAVAFLLEHDGNWNMTGVNNGTALHRAAWDGDLPMVERLVSLGADITNRDNPFTATPLSWAQHNGQQEVFRWMRAHCAIDLHDAICFDLGEHIEARLRENPASVDERRDQWDLPGGTPLHWAASRQSPPAPSGRELVTLLLDCGADPNIVAGNGLTALDIAEAVKASGVAALLRQRGGKAAADL